MAEMGSACYVNSATNRASHFQAVWVKKKNNNNDQRSVVLSVVVSASEEGSQRTCSPGNLDSSQVTLKKPEHRKG